MCGIAGIIHRGATGNIGGEMSSMLQSLRHRGPDSTGFAIYGVPTSGELIMRFKVAEQEEARHGFAIIDKLVSRRAEVDKRIESMGGEIVKAEQGTD